MHAEIMDHLHICKSTMEVNNEQLIDINQTWLLKMNLCCKISFTNRNNVLFDLTVGYKRRSTIHIYNMINKL